MSSSRTADRLVEDEEVVMVVVAVAAVEGEGEDRWRGEWPGERSMVLASEIDNRKAIRL